MIYLFCGSIIGTVMGLTGAGGALVAIPLFIHFLGMDLKSASVYSLMAVVLASLLNYVAQRKETQYRVGVIIIATSAVGSFLMAPFKDLLPSLIVAILLALVSLYALYAVWVPIKTSNIDDLSIKHFYPKALSVGFILGALTTFTGLGGGVLMLPIFLGFFGFSQPQAVATGLLAVGMSSMASLVIQVSRGAQFEVNGDLLILLLGILCSVLVLKLVTMRFPLPILARLRQIVFTLVVILAFSKIF